MILYLQVLYWTVLFYINGHIFPTVLLFQCHLLLLIRAKFDELHKWLKGRASKHKGNFFLNEQVSDTDWLFTFYMNICCSSCLLRSLICQHPYSILNVYYFHIYCRSIHCPETRNICRLKPNWLIWGRHWFSNISIPAGFFFKANSWYLNGVQMLPWILARTPFF